MTEIKKADVSPKLYEAATESLVSDASAVSTFEKMISVAYTHSTVDTFAKELKATESLIKKEFEVSSMPSPWRSGKSVVMTAMKMNIALIDSNGTFYGKTYLQNKIKEGKKEETTPVTLEEFVTRICNLIGNVPEHLSKGDVYREVGQFVASL